MSSVERRHAVRTREAPRSLPATTASDRGWQPPSDQACLVLGAGPVLGVLGSPAGGLTTSVAPLGVAIASSNGDAVTSTPSESALSGTDATDQVTVSNTTAGTQTNLSVPINLPPAFTLHSGTVTPSTGKTTMVAGSVLTWTIPGLAGCVGHAQLHRDHRCRRAGVRYHLRLGDQRPGLHQGQHHVAAVEVITAADLTIGVTDGADTIAAGASDTYTITLTNNGPSPATNATVTGTFDAGFAAMSTIASIGGTTFTDLGGGQFQWTGINLASGASATFTLIGNVPSPLTAGSAFVGLATVSLPPDQVDTDAVANAIDSDVVSGTTSVAPGCGHRLVQRGCRDLDAQRVHALGHRCRRRQ